MTVTSLSYLFIESVEGKQYKVVAKAWVGSALLTMVGAAMQPTSFGGQGWTTGQVHMNIHHYYEYPIATFIGLALLGFFAGGLGYLIAMRSEN